MQVTLLFFVAWVLASTDKELGKGAANELRDSAPFPSNCTVKEPIYRSVVAAASRYLHSQIKPSYGINIWYNPDEPIGTFDCGQTARAVNVGRRLIFTSAEELWIGRRWWAVSPKYRTPISEN